MTYLKFAVIFSLMLLARHADACSIVSVEKSGKSTLGYTMEWVGEIANDSTYDELQPYVGGGIFTQTSGLAKKSVFSENSFCWVSKYKSVVLSVFGPDMPFNGINEKGLEVYLLGTPSLVVDKRKLPQVSEFDVLPILLDTAKDLKEVETIFKKLKVRQYLFPLHFFIKEKSGKTLIVDFNEELRFHYPKAGEAILTNNWYDEELAAREANERNYSDDRHLDIKLHLKKRPDDIDGALAQAGDSSRTLWRNLSVVTATSWNYTVKVMPNAKSTKRRQEMTFDLEKLFSSKKFPKETQIIRFSDFSKNMSVDWRPLTEEENRLIQLANYKVVEIEESILLGRNGTRYTESLKTLDKWLKTMTKKPISNSSLECSK